MAPAWLTRFFVYALLVNSLGGLLVGYAIGIPAVAMNYYATMHNCDAYLTRDGCVSVDSARCVWDGKQCNFPQPAGCEKEATRDKCLGNPTHCLWNGDIGTGVCYPRPHCSNYSSAKKTCEDEAYCQWDPEHKKCGHLHGWQPWEKGVFAGAMIVGGMVASPLAKVSLDRLGRRVTLGIVGLIGLVSSAMITFGWMYDVFPLIVTSRVVVGAAVGIACVVCPMYVGEMAPAPFAGVLGVMFQILCTFGIMLAALLGWAANGQLHIQSRFQGILALQWVMSAVLIPLAVLMPESTAWKQERRNSSATNQDDINYESERVALKEPSDDGGNDKSSGHSGSACKELTPFLILVGCLLAAAQQLSGINAIMNYVPMIAEAHQLDGLLINFIVMLWNFVTTLVSVPLAKVYAPRTTYVGGCFIVSAACLLTGIPTFPAVPMSDGLRLGLAATGILIFIAGFELGMGPSFYVLAQAIFPDSVRSTGCGMTITVQFVFNLMVNALFPIAVVAFSGGKDHDQNKGMAIMFIIFGTIGLTCATGLQFTLPKKAVPVATRDLIEEPE